MKNRFQSQKPPAKPEACDESRSKRLALCGCSFVAKECLLDQLPWHGHLAYRLHPHAHLIFRNSDEENESALIWNRDQLAEMQGMEWVSEITKEDFPLNLDGHVANPEGRNGYAIPACVVRRMEIGNSNNLRTRKL